MTSKELAAMVGVAESTMSLYENGKREPDFRTLKRIAACLNTNIDYLLGAECPKKIPLLGSVAAGVPISAITDIEDYVDVPGELASAGEHVALRIQGNSMEPRICRGDIVIVRLQSTVESGEIAVVLIDDEATVKRVYFNREDGILTLMPENPTYKPMRYMGSQLDRIRILGKVVSGQYKI